MIHMSSRASPGGSSALRTRCTRRSLFVTVPSVSHHEAAEGKTTSAISAVLVSTMSCTTRKSSSGEELARLGDVGLGLRRVLADHVERAQLAALHARGTSASGASRSSGRIVVPQAASNRARASSSRSMSWKPGSLFGIAPMSPPPWTLFWPRSGLRPEPKRPTWPQSSAEVDQREDVVDGVVVLGDPERPADHRRGRRARTRAPSRGSPRRERRSAARPPRA